MPDHELEFFEHLLALKRAGRSFATALVVSRRSPVSSHLGDRAIVLADGRMQGFVGGACSREVVRRQALEAMASGQPRLVQIRPDARSAGFTPDAEHVVIPMSCASEGAVDVYIEPYLRPPLLLVAGFTPVAEALARLGQALDYEVVRVVSAEERGDLGLATRVVSLDELPAYLGELPPEARSTLMTVVASQGYYDEEALEALLTVRPPYVGLLASRKRGSTVKEILRQRGVPEDAIAGIRNPVGLALGGRSPADVAVSVLAEIVQARSRMEAAANLSPAPATGLAVDPVCGMEVEIGSAAHVVEHDGHSYYFCCPRCKTRFEQEPAQYFAAAKNT
jgi:xanthine dehydrogenase accessory factor